MRRQRTRRNWETDLQRWGKKERKEKKKKKERNQLWAKSQGVSRDPRSKN